MTRAEHLAWCKKRAHEYRKRGDIKQAIASMLSDLGKHPDTVQLAGRPFSDLGLLAAMHGNRREAENFIDGFT